MSAAPRLFSALAILLLYTRITITAASSVICYNSLGLSADNYVPCDPTGVTTHACCRLDDICFQNGLCVGSLGAGITPYYTSMCIIASYNAIGCFDNCNNSSGNGVQECGGSTSGEYCCYGLEGCDCNDSAEVFGLGVAVALTTLPASTSTPTSTSTAISATASVASNTTRTVTTTSAATTAGASTPATATTTSPASASGGTNHTARDVGLSVGILVVVITLALLVWLYQRHRRRTRASNGNLAIEKPELDATRGHGSLPNHGVAPHEMGNESWAVEKEANDRVFEMPAHQANAIAGRIVVF